MSQVEQQNTQHNSLFKSFEDIKPENSYEQTPSFFKSAPTITSQSDIMSTTFYI